MNGANFLQAFLGFLEQAGIFKRDGDLVGHALQGINRLYRK
jgi:hypothetical protein